MPIAESSALRLVLRSGSTTLTLDKAARTASLRRKILFWERKPVEVPFSEIAYVTVDAAVDRASGVEVCQTTVVTRTGAGWSLSAANKKEAQSNATALRDFIGLPH